MMAPISLFCGNEEKKMIIIQFYNENSNDVKNSIVYVVLELEKE